MDSLNKLKTIRKDLLEKSAISYRYNGYYRRDYGSSAMGYFS
jgi:hypothetical protein